MSMIAVFPGQGAAIGRHGPGPGRRLSGSAGRVRGGRRRPGRAVVGDHLRRPGRAADPDRQRPAGTDGDIARGRAGAGGATGRSSPTMVASSPATAWANIRPWLPRVRYRYRRCRRLLRLRGQAMQDAVAPGDGAMAAILGTDVPTVERWSSRCRGAGRGLRARQRQWRRPTGHLRQRGRGRAGRGAGQGARRPAQRHAAGLRTLSLRADAAGGRSAGRGDRGAGTFAAAGRAADRQCHRRAGDGSLATIRRPAGPAGDRPGCAGGRAWRPWRGWASTPCSSSEPARC